MSDLKRYTLVHEWNRDVLKDDINGTYTLWYTAQQEIDEQKAEIAKLKGELYSERQDFKEAYREQSERFSLQTEMITQKNLALLYQLTKVEILKPRQYIFPNNDAEIAKLKSQVKMLREALQAMVNSARDNHCGLRIADEALEATKDVT